MRLQLAGDLTEGQHAAVPIDHQVKTRNEKGSYVLCTEKEHCTWCGQKTDWKELGRG